MKIIQVDKDKIHKIEREVKYIHLEQTMINHCMILNKAGSILQQ